MSSSYSSSSYSYSSSSTVNGQTTVSGSRHAQTANTDASGNTTIHSASQNLGEAPVVESRHFDSQGRPVIESNTTSGNRIEDVTDADKKYLEAMEDEYAKREGGA